VNDFVVEHFPNDTWDLEFYVGSTIAGGRKDAEEYQKKFSGFLDEDKEANELRELAYKISSQGKLINSMIEKELRKH
jgi:hypothetical protein